VSLKKNTIANYIGQFYVMFIGIFMLPFYLKYLGAEAYGLVGFFAMLISWMAILDMGFSSVLSREAAKIHGISENYKLFHKSLRSVETFFLLTSAIFIVILMLLSEQISTYWFSAESLSRETISKSLQIMSLIIGLRLFVSLYQGAIIGFERQVWLNGYKIVFYSIRFIGAFFLLKYISNEIISFFLFQLLIALIEFYVIRNKLYNISIFIKSTAFFTFERLKDLAPFALSVAYGAILWAFVTQIDKLLLSHFLPLKEYGYFSLVVVIANAVLLMFLPIGQAILPRLTSLITNNKNDEVVHLYRQATEVVSIIVFSVVAIIAMYSKELLYAWTGNMVASEWGGNILKWYALGNGIAAVSTMLYYLQHSHGNLKYHIKASTFFGVIQISCMIYAVYFYSAIGAAFTYFILQLLVFICWSAFVHNKFLVGYHFKWLIQNMGIYLLVTLIAIMSINLVINFDDLGRVGIFILLLCSGALLLGINTGVFYIKKKYIYH
jgi:O-antigen/teichoic acid export membrane protein